MTRTRTWLPVARGAFALLLSFGAVATTAAQSAIAI